MRFALTDDTSHAGLSQLQLSDIGRSSRLCVCLLSATSCLQVDELLEDLDTADEGVLNYHEFKQLFS